MSITTDIIIIGAGIIGTATAFELAQKGYKTINVDKLPAAGKGSTGSSSAGIRTHYSNHEGVVMAYEGYFHWQNREDYFGFQYTTNPIGRDFTWPSVPAGTNSKIHRSLGI